FVYRLDIKNSKLLWKAKKVNGGHNGYVLFQSGEIKTLSPGKYDSGYFNIHMNSIVAVDKLMRRENREVEGVVKANNFFAVALYPMARMRVHTIVPTGRVNQYKVRGDLTVKGVTKPLEFLAMFIRSGKTLSAVADFKIDRTKWGINYKSGSFFTDLKDELIEDDIEISLRMFFSIPEGC
ncbi:MAG: YceI family protein, partial [Pedobacter sp.]